MIKYPAMNLNPGRIIFALCLLASVTLSAQADAFYQRLSTAAIELIDPSIRYDGSYHRIPYPNGDVEPHTGVCTDVVIRAYRKLGIDLQKEVHEDMSANFSVYPPIWRRTETDRNIDHRRVPNLMKFFSRHGQSLKITNDPANFQTGDVVAWNLYGGTNHIGIVVDKKSSDGKRYLVVHNIGGGQVAEDCLFSWKVIGHYRYKN
jgi:uncharacterized protein YijF (DUF1287 family)